MNRFFKSICLMACFSLLSLFISCNSDPDRPSVSQPSYTLEQLSNLIAQAEGRYDAINWGESAFEFEPGTYWVPKEYRQGFRDAIDAAKMVLNANPTDAQLGEAIANLQEAIMLTFQMEQPGAAVDKSQLLVLITQASEVLQNLETSIDGSEFTSAQQWVTPQAYEELELALGIARAVYEAALTDPFEVHDAVIRLTTAINNLNARPGLSELIAIINKALETLEPVMASADGADVYIFRQWVTPVVYSNFEYSIEAAQLVLADVSATREIVDNSVSSLTSALAAFEAALAFGSLTAFIVSFDTGGGSIVEDVIVLPGGKVTKPEGVTRFTIRELYYAIIAADAAAPGIIPAGAYNLNSIALLGWNNNGTPWDFDLDIPQGNITLTAEWSAVPVPYNPAFTFAQAIATGNMPIIFVLRNDINVTGMTLASRSANVTFLGLGGQRTITQTDNLNLFNLTGDSSVTLGKNIRLTRSDRAGPSTFIQLTGDSRFTMLEGSEISDVRSNVEGAGVVMTIGEWRREPVYSPPTTATFTMEGGLITRNMIGRFKYTWVSIIMVYDGGGKIIMRGGSITGNNYYEHGTDTGGADGHGTGLIIPGKRVGGGDICFDRAIRSIPFEISGNAEVDHIFVGNNIMGSGTYTDRDHYFTIGHNWTGRIGALILDREAIGWLGGPFVGAAGGHTLTTADINRIGALMHYPALNNPSDGGFPIEDMAPLLNRRISNSGDNIGFLLEVTP